LRKTSFEEVVVDLDREELVGLQEVMLDSEVEPLKDVYSLVG
jgi:hypothetical protein